MKVVGFVGERMTAGVFLWLMTGLLIVSCTQSGVAQQVGEVVDIGNRSQVFIDGRYLESTEGCRIVVCPPQKTYERCLKGLRHVYVRILPVDGTFRGFNALTKDGANWRRVYSGTAPEPDDLLGLRYGGEVPFVDPTAPPEERYKLYDGLYNKISVSSDGANWELLHKGVFPGEALYPRGMDSQNVCFYDTRLDKFVAYVRVNRGGRAIGRSVTDDLSRFPMPEVVLEHDEKDAHFGGAGVVDFYIPSVVQYPHAQDAYYLFNSRYLHYEDSFLADDLTIYPDSGHNTGAVDIGLAASRDGIQWYRYDRKPWISLDPESRLDPETWETYASAGLPRPQVAHTNLWMAWGMYLHEDEIWMYYAGTHAYHWGNVMPQMHELRRVVLPKHRFTAVEADYTGGEFTTCPVQFEGEALHLNIETSALGLARVEIQDADGNSIEGFSLDDCDRIHTANTVDRVVTWRRGESDVSALAGQPVRLRFELQFGAKLYAFRFGAG